jgi:3-phosphoshikimate 1-carboxyvinyltransferase
MQLTVLPSNALKGTFGGSTTPGLPGDKSISHRAALLAGMASGDSHIENFMVSGVTRVLLKALELLGVEVELSGNVLRVHSPGYRKWKTPAFALNCGNSATTMRLLAGAIAASGVQAVLDGSDSLRRRPMDRIIEPLLAMGVSIQGTPDGCAPLKIGGRSQRTKLHPLEYSLPVASAQVKTCLLLAGLAASGQIILHEPETSRDHTERMLSGMGIQIDETFLTGHTIRLSPESEYEISPLNMQVPGDFSSAAFLIVAGLIAPGSQIQLSGVGLNETRTGLLDVLKTMGGNILITGQSILHSEPVGNLIIRSSALQGVTVQGSLVVRMIDEFPALAAAAIYALGTTSVRDAEELHYKETDRITSLCEELSNIGATIAASPDGFILQGDRSIHGGTVASHKDHRLAMSLAVAGLASQTGVVVKNAEIIRESFPAFIDVLGSAGANIQVVED